MLGSSNSNNRGPMQHAFGKFDSAFQTAGERFAVVAATIGQIADCRSSSSRRLVELRAFDSVQGTLAGDVLVNRQFLIQDWATETRSRFGPAPRAGSCGCRYPPTRMQPRWTGSNVQSKRNSVVLPLPLGPSSAKISPASDVQVQHHQARHDRRNCDARPGPRTQYSSD